MITRLRRHSAPVETYFAGLGLSLAALSAACSYLAIRVSLQDSPPWIMGLAAAGAAAISFVSLLGRESLKDLWTTLETNAKMAVWILVGSLMILAGHFPAGPWSIVAALGAGQFLLCFGLVSPRGFARYYIVAGLAAATSCGRLPLDLGLRAAAGFALLLCLTLAYETHFFATHRVKSASYASPLRPFVAALWRCAAAAAIAWAIMSVLPPMSPFLRTGEAAVSAEELNPRKDPREFEMNLVKAFIATMAMFLLLLVLLALMRYIRQKFRRKAGALPAESIGVPVAAATRLADMGRRKRMHLTGTPLEKIVAAYRHFGEAAKAPDARRKPSQTPEEYAILLANRGAYQRRLVDSVTDQFEEARYGPAAPDEESASRFVRVVEQTIAHDHS